MKEITKITNKNNHWNILTTPIAVTNYTTVVNKVLRSAHKRVSCYICISNVHMCMEAFDNHDYCNVVQNAALTVPDGRPLVWCLKLLGNHKAEQVRGADLMIKICQKAECDRIPVGLYGGTPESLEILRHKLQKLFPSLDISFYTSPPFRSLTHEEEKTYINNINNTNTKILFVGLGCPKQEIWMAEHQGKLSCVMIGVGAAFDFLSGKKKIAPIWMQRSGLEWFFRLIFEPRRMLHRYLKHNPRFAWYFLKQLFSRKSKIII